MQVGAAMTVVGVIVVLAIFLPWADGIDNRPLWLNLLALLGPLGLAVAVYGAGRGARRRQRQIAIRTGELPSVTAK